MRIPKCIDDHILDVFRTPEQRLEHKAKIIYEQVKSEIDQQRPGINGWVLIDTTNGGYGFFADDKNREIYELKGLREACGCSDHLDQLYIMEHGKVPAREIGRIGEILFEQMRPQIRTQHPEDGVVAIDVKTKRWKYGHTIAEAEQLGIAMRSDAVYFRPCFHAPGVQERS
ncbi:MAG: hypothetical protein AABX04_07060 [Nanoarchaeota archaeon]